MIPFHYNDGGRAAAGFKTTLSGDCVARSVAIASGVPYRKVYDYLAAQNKSQRQTKHSHPSCGKLTASDGIMVQRKWFKDYMTGLGFLWVPTMAIGSGCRVHLRAAELPMGRLVVNVSRHLCAVIDGVLEDLSDCSRGGMRCVYGFWRMSK